MIQAFSRALQDDRIGLSPPWDCLANLVRPLPGNLVLILGAPGVGKSMFSLLWALEQGRSTKDGPWTRLISLDTNAAEQAARVISWTEGIPASAVLEHPDAWARYFDDKEYNLLVQTCILRPAQLAEVMEVDRMYLGSYPDFVVVDDLSKMQMTDRSYTDYNTAFLDLHRVARSCGNVVAALHHIHRGDNSAGSRAIRLSDGVYGGEYEAEIVLGLWRPMPNTLRVGVLKNRMGAADPTGQVYVDLHVDYNMTQIRELIPGDRFASSIALMVKEFDAKAI